MYSLKKEASGVRKSHLVDGPSVGVLDLTARSWGSVRPRFMAAEFNVNKNILKSGSALTERSQSCGTTHLARALRRGDVLEP